MESSFEANADKIAKSILDHSSGKIRLVAGGVIYNRMEMILKRYTTFGMDLKEVRLCSPMQYSSK